MQIKLLGMAKSLPLSALALASISVAAAAPVENDAALVKVQKQKSKSEVHSNETDRSSLKAADARFQVLQRKLSKLRGDAERESSPELETEGKEVRKQPEDPRFRTLRRCLTRKRSR